MKYFYLLLLCVILPCKSQEKQPETKPNIIYINVDDLGWMDTETYGSTFYETPNITKLAKSGMQFTNAYAAAANCAPSRACLISGQNTPRHGIYTVANSDRGHKKTRKLIPIKNTLVLADSVVTIAETLKKAGYVTGTFGKWHLGENPKTQGFDINVAGGAQGNPGRDGYFSPYNINNIENKVAGENLTDRLTQDAISFIKDNKDNPFFLYLPYYAVHTPLSTSTTLKEKYVEKGGNSLQNEAVYAGMIETVDTNLGRILNAIKDLKLKNTLIVFTSDNGGIRKISKQEPLRAGKGSYYEGGIRVPLIMAWADVIKPNTLSGIPISNLDFYPTVIDILNIKLPNKVLDGNSLLPLFKGGEFKERSLYFHFPIYLQAYSRDIDDARDPLFRTRPGSVIIDGDWKLHHYFEDNDVELYNLKSDLGERTNLAELYPEKALELLMKLNKWRAKVNAPIPTELNPYYDYNYDKKSNN